MSRWRIKPGIAPSLIGVIVGLLFVILGLTVFIPLTNAAGFPASIFAIIWKVSTRQKEISSPAGAGRMVV